MKISKPPDKDIVILGCGPGSRAFLTYQVVEEAEKAQTLLGSPRLLALFTGRSKLKIELTGSVEESLSIIEKTLKNGTVGVAVSGDPGLYSLASLIARRFGRERCRAVAGLSSAQVAFAKLGISWENAKIISVHGRRLKEEKIDLASASPIAVLCGDQNGQSQAADLTENLSATHQAWLCVNLGLDGESIRRISAAELRQIRAEALTIVVLSVAN